MNYTQAVDFIESAALFGIKLGLANIKKLLELVGNPQDGMKIVHVAGTNGKGSVCSYIANILIEAGYKTGMFTSPYLEKFTERMQVNLKNIPDDKVVKYVEILKEKIDIMVSEGYNHPTFFELNTAMTLMYFKEESCDAVVLEVGLGGRYDSTNIISNPIVSVITTIEYDHTAILGDTLSEIAYQKAGIIKKNRPVAIYGEMSQKALSVIKWIAAENRSEFLLSDNSQIKNIKITDTGYIFDYRDIKGIEISMMGQHQIKNACLAVDAASIIAENGLPISNNEIIKGLKNTRWPGRVEILNNSPLIICDATHNPQGAEVLKAALAERFKGRKIVYLMGVMKDKSYEKMAEIVLKEAFAVITVTPSWHRALDAHILLDTVKKYCENAYAGDTIKQAMEMALKLTGDDGIVCSFGSLYYVAEVKNFVRENFSG
ncbi:MAG: bifunctional folylpolyglutamate synthase/dihydrofolate synthase [Clostridiales bacterium]|nr:bifunctional folylpolyglutamate synthase/dihydrofolate synthase [Clostridiales bacterium]